MKSPHINITLNELGQAIVRVQDDEVFDYVEDFLIEEQDLEYLWVQAQQELGHPTWHAMTFDGELMPRLQVALALLEPKYLHDIFLINNPAPHA